MRCSQVLAALVPDQQQLELFLIFTSHAFTAFLSRCKGVVVNIRAMLILFLLLKKSFSFFAEWYEVHLTTLSPWN